jgi:glycosyltransferase involved in cell wall biosynthesis
VHVVLALEAGGLERLVLRWTQARNRQTPGSTRICCLDEPGRLARQVEGEAVTCVYASRQRFPFDVTAVMTLRGLLRNALNDAALPVVVHSHNLAAQQYAALAAVGLPVGHVHTEHGTNPHHRGWCNRVRNAWLAHRTDRIVAVSADTALTLQRHQRVPAAKLTVIPNGVAPHAPPPPARMTALRNELGLPPDATVLGSVGRLARVKGYDRLIAAFAALCGVQRPDGGGRLVLVLVGDGPERAALERQADELAVRDRIVFAGYRDDAEDLMALMSLFVLPSLSEGLPVALLEAMLAGVPVAATDVGENRRVLADGACGTLLPAEAERWAEIIGSRLALAGKAESRAQVARARERVDRCYSLTATMVAYEQVYRSEAVSCHAEAKGTHGVGKKSRPRFNGEPSEGV